MEHRWANNQFRFTTQSFKLFRMNFHPIMKCYPTLVEGWRNSRKRMRKKELCSFSWDWMIVMLPFMDKSYWYATSTWYMSSLLTCPSIRKTGWSLYQTWEHEPSCHACRLAQQGDSSTLGLKVKNFATLLLLWRWLS